MRFEHAAKNPPAAFCLVWRNGGYNSTPHYQHPIKEDAQREAERLAAANPGVAFYVLPAFDYAIARVNPTAWATGDSAKDSDAAEEVPF